MTQASPTACFLRLNSSLRQLLAGGCRAHRRRRNSKAGHAPRPRPPFDTLRPQRARVFGTNPAGDG
jgi:hypothetical protein